MFKESDKVVCIDGDFGGHYGWHLPGGEPKKDSVYVVRDTVLVPWDSELGLVLVGLPAICILPEYGNGTIDEGWPCSHFRKLDEIQEENRKSEFIEVLDATGTKWVKNPAKRP